MTIRKEGSQFCVITSRSKECFSSRKKANERLRQIEFFKNQKMAEYKKKKRREMAEDVLRSFGETMESFTACEKYGDNDPRCKGQRQLAERLKVIASNREGKPLLRRKT